jgi:hypothetical protein
MAATGSLPVASDDGVAFRMVHVPMGVVPTTAITGPTLFIPMGKSALQPEYDDQFVIHRPHAV